MLGRHDAGGDSAILLYLPRAHDVTLDDGIAAARVDSTDFFLWRGRADLVPARYRVHWNSAQGAQSRHDPYAFAPELDAGSLGSFGRGTHHSAWEMLGAIPRMRDGIAGVRFAVWAPHAERVSVVGPFCQWDGRQYPMSARGSSGVFELFIPNLGAGELYKFEIRHRETGALQLKSDPYANEAELRPATASRVAAPTAHVWRDGEWLAARGARSWLHAPMSIYEVHAGSWQRHDDGRFLSWRELADTLVPYVSDLGYTHIELLPVTEHPLDDSWGYQTTGYFAPTSRHGSPDDLRHFIDTCHAAGIGVLLDWVPGHFPRDGHALARFDGEPLYEYADPRRGEHRDWGTLVFDYERHEVRSFLLSSACYWLAEFHFDGLRVDAVASMLYLDFSRRGDFVPNRHGGRENLEAIAFLRELNALVHARFPGAVVIAEESTDWPMVSRPADHGGLGFSMKWNMGWMHDTLAYFGKDPLYRSHHHRQLTFAMMYAYTENFVLPLSHDEVVHLKRSLLGRMPGDAWQRLANLRLLYLYMWTMPGKKLLFMGGEFGQETEWDFASALPWALARDPAHAGVTALVRDLNRLYAGESPLHRYEFESQGFQWLDCDDAASSILAYVRRDGARFVIVALNFTPVPRTALRIGVPESGHYREILNSDSAYYGGSNLGNPLPLATSASPYRGQPHSLVVTLPPLGGVVLTRDAS
ncbi:MAG: 1,4-alpha-glucan branching enzyme GlgB [Steroidobacteraceae bacterium]|nr:1,4-alpha-glucan branching enzyme GlgB [Steroidobacteraceae bacterium]